MPSLRPLVDHALGVAEHDVVRVETHRLDQFDAGDCRSTCAVADELGCLEVTAGQFQCVDQAGGGDDRAGAVLVVVEDGDIHQLAQALLDNETVRRLDVLEIDAAERRAEDSGRS